MTPGGLIANFCQSFDKETTTSCRIQDEDHFPDYPKSSASQLYADINHRPIVCMNTTLKVSQNPSKSTQT